MIRKQDILDRAAEWRLRPDVVEKDYVLGWLLAGLSSVPFAKSWVFKGGTCIKKCYLETYRFSEDLDFSLLPDAEYTESGLAAQVRTLVRAVAELSGLAFPVELVEVRTRRNLQGQLTFEARVGYVGPLAYPGPPKLRFDLTRHEAVLDVPSERRVVHPYPDELPGAAVVRAYSFNELLAEKTRALLERSRPRDLYDVVHLLENPPTELDITRTRELFVRKCGAKAIPVPTARGLIDAVRRDEELRSEWENMLGHQLPALPDLDGFLDRLPGLLAWVDAAVGPQVARPLPAVVRAPSETPMLATGIRYWGSGSSLETIRFAASNRLVMEFHYHGKVRRVEPYAVRQAQTGNILLYGWELASDQIKAYKLAEMTDVRVSRSVFVPRYAVEMSAVAPAIVLPAPRQSVALPRRQAASSRPSRSGPTYVFECPVCRRRFSHGTQDSTLQAHKDRRGWNCSGRRGYLVDTRY